MRNIQEFSESIVAAGEMGAVRAKRAWNASLLLCMLALTASLCACASGASSITQSAADVSSSTAEAAYLQGTSFAPETEKAINDFIASYGKDLPAYDGSAYVVSDFDNTTSIFDITYQCSVYQLQSMSFSLDPEGLVAALSTGIDAEKNAPWLDDIGAAYSYLWENYGPFTAAGLDEQARVRAAVDAFGLSDCVTGVIGMTQQRHAQRYVAAYDYETGYKGSVPMSFS